MQPANTTSVKGGFDNVRFRYDDVVSTFFQRDGRYWVRTDGPDGKLADFEIKHVRCRSASAVPDRAAQGARAGPLDRLGHAAEERRRPEVVPSVHWRAHQAGDELHWTQRQQNWNFMRADCHSTNLRKQYDAAERQLPDHVERDERLLRGITAWIPARELGAAGTGIFLDPSDRQRPDRAPDRATQCRLDDCPDTLKPMRSAPRTTSSEIDVCAQRHSRRSQITDGVLTRGTAARFLRARDDRAFACIPRRPAAGGSLYPRLVPAESNGARRRHLQRLSRAPFGDAPRPGKHALHTLPCLRAL